MCNIESLSVLQDEIYEEDLGHVQNFVKMHKKHK